MGVYVDKYFGYFMDVTEEYNKSKQLWDDYYDGKMDNPELIALKVVPYYSDIKQKEDDITLLYDGMCGEYSKLVLIKTVEKYSDDESEPNERANDMLKLVPIPPEIKERMEKVYKIVFGESQNCPTIYLMQFAHFH